VDGSGVIEYLFRRLILMIPTFFGITLVSFLIINLAPGSPLEQQLQELRSGGAGGGPNVIVSEEIIAGLKKQYGFDKPILERYVIWLKNISRLDFGKSYFYEEPALDVIASKFPVSLQFGIGSLLLTYLISIPLGIAKAKRSGSAFDHYSGLALYAAYATPPLILAFMLITFFSSGSYFEWFPMGGLQSENFEQLSLMGKVGDRLFHFVLPLTCYVFGNFTELTLLMRNSLLDVLKADYVRTARAKGLSEYFVVYRHALRNALIPIATGLGGALRVFLAGSLIIETIFQLDGIGLLGYKSIGARDYNVIMAIIFLSGVTLMLGRLLSDFIYVAIDPRIHFSKRD
jgi:microcin C transport system permease protein